MLIPCSCCNLLSCRCSQIPRTDELTHKLLCKNLKKLSVHLNIDHNDCLSFTCILYTSILTFTHFSRFIHIYNNNTSTLSFCLGIRETIYHFFHYTSLHSDKLTIIIFVESCCCCRITALSLVYLSLCLCFWQSISATAVLVVVCCCCWWWWWRQWQWWW